jgi:hypothetical protein
VCTAGGCSPVTDATRIANANTLTAELQTGSTDANDPDNINGDLRTVLDAIQKDAFNNGVPGYAKGKKSLRVRNTTDFTLNCGIGAQQKIRVQVSDDREG